MNKEDILGLFNEYLKSYDEARHCIPAEVVNMTLDDYPHFLAERRRLMAKKIEHYYKGL